MWGSRTSHRKLVPLSLLPAHITNIRTRLIVMKRNSIRESEIWPQLRMRNSQRSVKVDGNKKSRLQLALSRMVPEGKAEIGVLGTRAGCHCSAQLEPYWIQWRWPFWVNVLEKKILFSADVRDAYFHGSRTREGGCDCGRGWKIHLWEVFAWTKCGKQELVRPVG